MFLGTFYFGGVEVSEELLESVTRWDSIVAPHKGIQVEGSKQVRNWGEFQAGEFYRDTIFTVTEKIDGTNMAWVIFMEYGQPQVYFIRSRKEFLMFSEDLIAQDKFNALSTLLPNSELVANLAKKLSKQASQEIICLYGELYGTGIQEGGKYSKDINWRIFGAKCLEPEFVKWFGELPRTEHHQHRWKGIINQDEIFYEAFQLGVPCAPMLGEVQGDRLDTVEKIKRYLGKLDEISEVAIQDGGTPSNALEGVVIRSDHPFQIYKLKYKSYIL